MADTNASLDFSISYVNNSELLLSGNPELFSEQPDMTGFVPTKNGAFDSLKGVRKIMGHLQVAERMIVGKDNNLTEVLGEDVRENTYTNVIAGCAARLDAQIAEETERTGKRPERLGWAYARKGAVDEYVTLFEIGETDERVRNSGAEEMPVEKKGKVVESVYRSNGEMDVAGERTHFRHVHWIYGESVEERAEKQVTVSRPILPLATPLRKREYPFPIAEIEGYDKDFVPVGKLLRMPIFALCDEDEAKIVLKGNRKNNNKDIKVANDFDAIRAVLTSEPMPVKVIAEKVGMTGLKVSKLLKNAIAVGCEIKIVVVKDEKGRVRPAFYL